MKTLTPHSTEFLEFIAKLAGKFQPLQIFCFSRNSFTQQSCFKNEQLSEHHHYCLLLVTESGTRIDYEVQDFANSVYKQGTITVICHCRKSIEQAISKNNRFFITVYKEAELLYGPQNLCTVPDYDPTHAAAKAREHYHYRFSLADGFEYSGNECISSQEQYGIGIFMLHQAVEQMCIGMIRIHLGYRSEFHNLHRLLQLCTAFSAEPLQVFTATPEDRRLFGLLCKSYSSARYKAGFTLTKEDTFNLCTKVMHFIILAKSLCEAQIARLEEEATSLGEAILLAQRYSDEEAQRRGLPAMGQAC